MEIAQLKYFQVMANIRHFTRAARMVDVSQPIQRNFPRAGYDSDDGAWVEQTFEQTGAPRGTGLRAATHAQVLEGLAEGAAVIVQPDERIVDGTRIEAH